MRHQQTIGTFAEWLTEIMHYRKTAFGCGDTVLAVAVLCLIHYALSGGRSR